MSALDHPIELVALALAAAVQCVLGRAAEVWKEPSGADRQAGKAVSPALVAAAAFVILVTVESKRTQVSLSTLGLWARRLLPVACGFAACDAALAMLQDCCDDAGTRNGLRETYGTSCLLILCIPLYLYCPSLSEANRPSQSLLQAGYLLFFVPVACAMLFVADHNGDDGCRLTCVSLFVPASIALSYAFARLFALGAHFVPDTASDRPAGGLSLAVPAGLLGLLTSVCWLLELGGIRGSFELPLAALGTRFVLFYALLRAVPAGVGLPEVVLTCVGGSCVGVFLSSFGEGSEKTVALTAATALCFGSVVLLRHRRRRQEASAEGAAPPPLKGGKLQFCAVTGACFVALLLAPVVTNVDPAASFGNRAAPLFTEEPACRTSEGVAVGVSAGGASLHARFLKPAALGKKRALQAFRTDRLVNGVIVYLDSVRKPIHKALTLLDKHFLNCWPYPVHVFKENLTDAYSRDVRRITKSQITFAEISFEQPPNNISRELVDYWINVKRYGRGHHYGYRMMCRFFAGAFTRYDFLADKDYYWRLDTDSWFRETLYVDPFIHLASHGCRYGHMSRLHRDAAEVTVNLYETVLEWAESYGVPRSNLTRLAHAVTDRGGYRRPMYYNNFELASVQWIRGDAYQSFFDYLDHTDGFMKYRWGDAPIRTIAVHLMLPNEEICDFEAFVPYHHGYYKNKDYTAAGKSRPVCPATFMQKNAAGSQYLHPPVYTNEVPRASAADHALALTPAPRADTDTLPLCAAHASSLFAFLGFFSVVVLGLTGVL
ncbi:Glycolipid 2-alpha-mannosyltransferase [Diplonema papillatum]|nr:Glycolipid 2-alpha-mannosyltransferase [Diplonema papillatum]